MVWATEFYIWAALLLKWPSDHPRLALWQNRAAVLRRRVPGLAVGWRCEYLGAAGSCQLLALFGIWAGTRNPYF